jgi:uncharacterized protein YndB with AHSA1/START domain/DNA-binding transcriptional ArsR family regulator
MLEDEVFRALADPNRRRLLDSLNARSGQTLNELCANLNVTRQSVSKHLGVLESANLITTVWRGREKLHYLNPAPINDIADRWIRRYDRARVQALADLKTALEETSMSTPEFVYTTYIHTTPEKLWQALTDPAFTTRYWTGTTLETDWAKGSPMTWVLNGQTRIEHPDQIVLEADPGRRLSYTWHTFSPEWAATYGIPDETRDRYAAEPRSRVTFDIEPFEAGFVKLTVTHTGFDDGSDVLDGVSQGWPMIISGLKTLLETGKLG